MPRGEIGQPGRVTTTNLDKTSATLGALNVSECLVERVRQLPVRIGERFVADGLFFFSSDQREFQYDFPARSACSVLLGECVMTGQNNRTLNVKADAW